MKPKLTLYTRKDCCLCDEMKTVVREVAAKIPLAIDEVDVDGSPELCAKFSNEVPVLFIDGRKAFKYRLTAKQLTRSLNSRSVKSWFL
jgi:glutaredoxin